MLHLCRSKLQVHLLPCNNDGCILHDNKTGAGTESRCRSDLADGQRRQERKSLATALKIEQSSEAEEIAELVARSRAAQEQIAHYTQEQVDALIRAMVWSVARPGVAEMIAQKTVDETQLGNYDGKYLKIFRKTRATLMDIIAVDRR